MDNKQKQQKESLSFLRNVSKRALYMHSIEADLEAEKMLMEGEMSNVSVCCIMHHTSCMHTLVGHPM